MAASRLLARRRMPLSLPTHSTSIRPSCRTFTSSSARRQQAHSSKESARARLRNTKIEWYWLPATAGIAFVGGLQSYRMYSTAQAKKEEEEEASIYSDSSGKPKKRKRIKPDGPWYMILIATFVLYVGMMF